MSRSMSVAVIGMGGIGGAVAACLALSGRHRVTACVRRSIGEITLDTAEGSVRLALDTATSPASVNAVDWVLVCTKAHDTASTSSWLKRLCGPITRVAMMQHGIGHADRVPHFVSASAVVPTVVHFNGERTAPDHFRLRHASHQDVSVPDTEAGRSFVHLFDGTSLKTACSADFHTLQWSKLLINAAANPVTALTRQRLAVLRRDDIRTLCLRLLDEGVAVARADGANLAEDAAPRIFDALMEYPPEVGTSMYFDSLEGRPLEADALTGAIIDAGTRLGIPTPVNETLLALLHAISAPEA